MMKVIYIFGLIAQVYFVQCRREDKVCMDNLKFCIPVSLFLWDKIFTFFFAVPLFQVVSFPNDICTGGSKNGTCYTTYVWI